MRNTSNAEPAPVENDPIYVNTHHHLRRQRRLKILLGIMTLFGTIATAAFAYAAKFIGANTPQTVNNTTVNHSEIWNGVSILAHSAVRGSTQVNVAQSQLPSALPDSKPVETVPPASPVRNDEPNQLSLIPGASCSGFDPKEWKLAAGEVNPLHSKNGNAYSLELRARNLSNFVKYITFEGAPYLTDNSGNRLNVSPSIFGGRFGDTGAKVNPGAELDVMFISQSTPQQLGSMIESLATDFLITPLDGNQKLGPSRRPHLAAISYP